MTDRSLAALLGSARLASVQFGCVLSARRISFSTTPTPLSSDCEYLNFNGADLKSLLALHFGEGKTHRIRPHFLFHRHLQLGMRWQPGSKGLETMSQPALHPRIIIPSLRANASRPQWELTRLLVSLSMAPVLIELLQRTKVLLSPLSLFPFSVNYTLLCASLPR